MARRLPGLQCGTICRPNKASPPSGITYKKTATFLLAVFSDDAVYQ
ncbi:hypothetical protein HMPREF0208_00152 [Citrobacter koseri]|nr:hypothetical protein HMPREF3207_00609 [Citrobacter koseri]KXB47308.1 hypothetical protein HMPREF0208_00152 [Citrobacter koseri]